MSVVIRPAVEGDLPDILRITNHAIAHTDALWISTPLTLEQRRMWMKERLEKGFPVLVAEAPDGCVCGYASYGSFRAFEGYAGTVEHSVYIDELYQGRGIGKGLMMALIAHARDAGLHVMVAGITADNVASVGLHRQLGFEQNGVLPEVGRKSGRWLDLLFMTLRL